MHGIISKKKSDTSDARSCGAVGIAALAAIRRARGAVRAGVAAVVPGRAERSAETQVVQLLPTVALAPRAAAAARAGAAAGARAHGSGDGGWEFGVADVWRAMLSEPLPGTLAILLLLTQTREIILQESIIQVTVTCKVMWTIPVRTTRTHE